MLTCVTTEYLGIGLERQKFKAHVSNLSSKLSVKPSTCETLHDSACSIAISSLCTNLSDLCGQNRDLRSIYGKFISMFSFLPYQNVKNVHQLFTCTHCSKF